MDILTILAGVIIGFIVAKNVIFHKNNNRQRNINKLRSNKCLRNLPFTSPKSIANLKVRLTDDNRYGRFV